MIGRKLGGIERPGTIEGTVNKGGRKTLRRRILRRIKEDGCRTSLRPFLLPRSAFVHRAVPFTFSYPISLLSKSLLPRSNPDSEHSYIPYTPYPANPITPSLSYALGSFSPVPSVSILTVTPSSNSSRRAVRTAALSRLGIQPEEPFVLEPPGVRQGGERGERVVNA